VYTNNDNEAAFWIYEKAGFILEGVMRQHKWKNGAFQNRRIYGMLRTEWEDAEWKEDLEHGI